MAEFIDPPTPFSSTKAWKDFLARAEAAPVKSAFLLSAIGTAQSELKRRARYKGRPYWEDDPPEEPKKERSSAIALPTTNCAMSIPAPLRQMLANMDRAIGPLSGEDLEAVIATKIALYRQDRLLSPEYEKALKAILVEAKKGRSLREILGTSE